MYLSDEFVLDFTKFIIATNKNEKEKTKRQVHRYSGKGIVVKTPLLIPKLKNNFKRTVAQKLEIKHAERLNIVVNNFAKIVPLYKKQIAINATT